MTQRRRHYPDNKRDGWISHKLKRRKIEISRAFEENPGGTIKEWLSNFMHNFPKALFISLPLFALILKLLYYRHRRIFIMWIMEFSPCICIFFLSWYSLDLFGLTGSSRCIALGIIAWMEFALIVYAFVYYYQSHAQVLWAEQGKNMGEIYTSVYHVVDRSC